MAFIIIYMAFIIIYIACNFIVLFLKGQAVIMV